MSLPLTSLVLEGREIGLVVAVGIGFAFGFVLERAGFGRATKLAAQFYGYDMTVFKVMFGAIVTAALGLSIFSGLGLIDLRGLAEQAASPTFVWPMLVGGLLLGAGFIISGYCPGTSVVATASGNLDGLVTFGGVVVGSLVYNELYPLLHAFHQSGDLGPYFLDDLLPLPWAAIAALVAVAAIGCFVGAEALERVFQRRAWLSAPSLDAPRPRRYVFAGFGAAAVVGLLLLLVPRARPVSAHPLGAIEPAELAERLIAEPWRFWVLDLRPREACAVQRVPGAECAPDLLSLGLGSDPGSRDVVLVAEGDLETSPPGSEGYRGRLLALRGGFRAWRAYALEDPGLPKAADRLTWESHLRRVGLHQAMTGAPPPPPPAPTGAPAAAPRPKKKGGGCS